MSSCKACSQSYFCGEQHMTNGRSPSTILLAITDKMSMASEIVACNLCYSLIALWGNDKKMLKNCCQNQLPCFSSMKKQFAGQIVPLLDMPMCYFKDPVMKRDKPES